MCRYGFHTYKQHYLCFHCRKQFKQYTPFEKMGDGLSDHYAKLDRKSRGEYRLPKFHGDYDRNNPIILLTPEEKIEYDALTKQYYSDLLCPQCRGAMAHVGLDIKAPKMSDKAAWKALQGSYSLGYTFGSCGCSGPGFVPTDKNEYKDFLEHKLAEYEQNLAKCIKSVENPELNITLYYDKFYWLERVDKIKEALKVVKP